MTVGRLAPTPSGLLHLGNARSFLLAWLWARREGGRVVLRIEDIDLPRCRPEYRAAILRDLEWLGLDWDELAEDQSKRFAIYREQLGRLVRAGLAYPDLRGRVHLSNAAAAICALGAVGLPIAMQDIRRGLAEVEIP